jgi:lysophospholipase L1-like esterase
MTAGVLVIPPKILRGGTALVVEGDSIPAGFGLSGFGLPGFNLDWLSQLSLLPGYTLATKHNVAQSATNLEEMTARYAANVKPYCQAASAASPAYLFLDGGTNSLSSLTRDNAATAFRVASAYWAQAKADGCLMIAFTVRKRLLEGTSWTILFETQRLAYNNLVRSAPAGSYDYLVDTDALFDDPADTIWYQDGLHPTAAGELLTASVIGQSILTQQGGVSRAIQMLGMNGNIQTGKVTPVIVTGK